MDLFDTLTWGEILVKTTFLGTPTLTVPILFILVATIESKEFQNNIQLAEESITIITFVKCYVNLIFVQVAAESSLLVFRLV
jgi:hypothetical protein